MSIEVMGIIVGIPTAILAIGGVLRGTWWIADKIGRTADAVQELLPGENGHRSLLDRVAHIEQQFELHLRNHQSL